MVMYMCWFVREWDVDACMYMHVFMHGTYICMNLFFKHLCVWFSD